MFTGYTLALLQESMKLMGMTSSAYWTSWFLSSWIILLIQMALITAVLVHPFFSNGAIIIYSDGTVIFFLFFCYSLALAAYFLMVSTFTDNGATA